MSKAIKHVTGAQVFEVANHPLFGKDAERVQVRFEMTDEGKWLLDQLGHENEEALWKPPVYRVVYDHGTLITYLMIFDAKLAMAFKLAFGGS